MKRRITFLSLILSISIILAACAQPDTEGKASEAYGSDDRILTIGVGVDLDPFIPISQNEYIRSICNLTYDTLVRYENGEIRPCLATSWEISPDGKEIMMQLRDDVIFHDRTPFNAQAAAKCLLYYKDYEMFSWMKGVSSIQDVEITGEYMIKISYAEGYYAALNDLTSSYKIPMVSENMIIDGNYETMNQAVGTGPYKFESYVKGDHTTFLKNDDYWGEDVAFDQIIVRYIPESGTRIKALKTGEIDMVFSSDFISYDEYRQAVSLEGIEGQLSAEPVKTRNMVVNAGSAVLSDVSVRQAIACAIDKDTIFSSLTYGQEQTADRLFTSNLPFCDVMLNHTWNYDPKRAIQLLEDAGWLISDGNTVREKEGVALSLVFTYPNDVALNQEIVSAIRTNLAAVGIEVETIGTEFMTWYVDSMEGNYDLAIGTTYGPPYDPQNYINPLMDSMVDTVAISGLHDSGNFFDAIVKSTATADEEEVTRLYAYMLNYLNDNAVEIPLSYQKEAVIYNSDTIENYDFGGMPNVLNPFGITPK